MKILLFIFLLPSLFACQHQTKTIVVEKFDTILVNGKPTLAKEIDSIEFAKYFVEEKFDTSENDCLKLFPQEVKRLCDTLLVSTNDSLFNLNLQNTYVKYEQDSFKKYVDTKYFFRGDFEKLHCWVIEIGYNCGSAAMVINKKNGTQLMLDPYPIEAPNGKKFLTAPYFMGDGSIKIYEPLNDELHLQLEITSSSFMIVNCSWVNENSIVILAENNNKPKYLLFNFNKKG